MLHFLGKMKRFDKCKSKFVEGDDLFYKWANKFFSLKTSAFIAPGVPLTSTAVTLLNLMIVLSLDLLR